MRFAVEWQVGWLNGKVGAWRVGLRDLHCGAVSSGDCRAAFLNLLCVCDLYCVRMLLVNDDVRFYRFHFFGPEYPLLCSCLLTFTLLLGCLILMPRDPGLYWMHASQICDICFCLGLDANEIVAPVFVLYPISLSLSFSHFLGHGPDT